MTLKQSIFNKWKSHLSEPKNTDENGNEFCICNGIRVVCVSELSMYLFIGRAIRKRFEDHVKNNRYDKIKSMFKRGTIKVIKP